MSAAGIARPCHLAAHRSTARPGPGLTTAATRPTGGGTRRLDAMRHGARDSAASFLAGMLGTMTEGLGGDDLLTVARARHSAPC
jgi:hypothetical protein